MEGWQKTAIDFVKWLIVAIGGAKVFEVVSNGYQNRRNKTTVRKHLYQELSSNYESVIYRLAISSSLEGLKQGTAHRFNDKLDITFEMRNQHDAIDKKLFWSIDEIQTLDSVYTKFNAVASETNPYRSRTLSIEAAAAFERAAKNGKLDNKLLKVTCSENVWKYLVEIIEGREKGASAGIDPF